jgi:hypothetical protein
MKKIAFISIIFLLLSTGLPVSGEVPWEVGDSYTYTIYYEGAFTVEENIANDMGFSSSGSSETTSDFAINEINETAKTVNYETIDTQGGRYNFTASYNSTMIGTNFGDFGAYYNQFDNKSGFYMSGIYFSSPFIDLPILVEPDFEEINNAFADLFNSSRVISALFDWSTADLTEFTLGDFLGNMTFWNIQGENNVDDVKDALDSGQRSYIMEFDLANVAVERINEYNGTHWVNEYYVYDEYKYIIRWDYQSNGELNSYSYDFRSSYSRGDATVSDHDVYELKQGGSAANNTNIPGFGLVTAIASIFILPVLIRRKK